jgi:septum formation protein
VPYEIVATTAEEVTEGDDAVGLAAANAVAKARQAALPRREVDGAFVLGTDTLVTVGGRVMGKPSSRNEAEEMIAALSGRTHQVVSGLALWRLRAEKEVASGARRTGVIASGTNTPENVGSATAAADERLIVATATTDVTFLRLDESQVAAYIASGEWADKAGAYAVQGLAATFLSEIRGEYSNVVGLPLCLLLQLFWESGFDLLRRQWI